MHFNRLTILIPVFIVLASAVAFAVHTTGFGSRLSIGISHAFADVGGDAGGGGDVGGDAGGSDSGGDSGGGSDSGGGTPPSPAPSPTCTLTAAPGSIIRGAVSTLTWTTTNAASFSIDQGIGSLTPVAGGTYGTSPIATATYRGTATNASGESATCETTITVAIPPPSIPTLALAKTEPTPGEGTTVHPGDVIFYELSYVTGGGVDQSNVQIFDTVPAHTTLDHQDADGADSHDFSCRSAGCNVWWIQRVLPSGYQSSVVMAVKVDADVPDGTKICNTGRIHSNQASTVYSNEVCNTVSNPPACPVNPPHLHGFAAVTLDVGQKLQPFSFDVGGGQPDSVTATGLPPGISFDQKTQTFSGTPTTAGTYAVTVKVKNQCGSDANTFTWTITSVNHPPTCTLTASPTAIKSGDQSKLAWTTTNAETVTLDPGLGTNKSYNDFQYVSPAKDTTYTLTVLGTSGDTVTCTASVAVTPPPPPACPVNPPHLHGFAAVTLAVGQKLQPFSFDVGGGQPDSVTATGLPPGISFDEKTQTFSGTPTTAGTYAVTVKVKNQCGSDANTFTWTITSVNHPPTCTLTASPTSIKSGDQSKLTWTTTNAKTVTLDPGLGTNKSYNDYQFVSPTSDTTYTLTVLGTSGDTVTCTASVAVTPPPPVTPTCTLAADASQVEKGGHVNLSWTSTNADTVSIDQGVGAVTPAVGGSVSSKAINDDTTFTATATSPTGKVVTCTASVSVKTGGGGGGPSCSMSVSPTSIQSGNSATLSWGGSEITSVDIDNGIGSSTTPGSTSVSPSVGSHTYTGTFHATDGETLTCSATLTVTGGGGGGGCTSNCGGGGGGGGPTPTVSLYSLATSSPLAYLYLSQIPYTGLDLGPVGTVLYWAALVAWSLALAYLVLFGGFPVLRRFAYRFGEHVSHVLNEPRMSAEIAPAAALPSRAVPPARGPAPAASAPRAPERPAAMLAQGAYSAYDGFKSLAQENKALTIDDIVKGLSQVPASVRPFAKRDDQAPEPAAAPSAKQPAPPAPVFEPEETFAVPKPIGETAAFPSPSDFSEAIAAAKPPAAREAAPAAPAQIQAEIPTFIEVLFAGERGRAFGMLREVARAGGDTEAFFTQVACALDDAYRARIEGAPVHPEIKRITDGVATPVLEKVVTAFTTAVDSSYSIGITGAKLALTRALATLGA